jgi:hypothetical protein
MTDIYAWIDELHDANNEPRPEDHAWLKEVLKRYLANEPQPVNNTGQAWGVIDGQSLTETDIRRLIQLNQAKQREIIRLNIEINHLNQHIVRLEREIDGGLTAVYSITPKGYDVLRELGM